jgi:predicted ATP-dependent endonuclease of OLD family
MKIKYLQISNILSFKFHSDIEDCRKIVFDQNLNIIIGENGSGKSTALEALNFILRRIFYRQYTFNSDQYDRKLLLDVNQKRQVLAPAFVNSIDGFRLQPNWATETQQQTIRLAIELDEIDRANIQTLETNHRALHGFFESFTTGWPIPMPLPLPSAATDTEPAVPHPYMQIENNEYVLEVRINPVDRTFTTVFPNSQNNLAYDYLQHYNYFKSIIERYNSENTMQITPLRESFSLIGSFRNYSNFTTSISLQTSNPGTQLQTIKQQEYARSVNTNDNIEPSIFAVVRLRVAELHFNLFDQKYSPEEREAEANRIKLIADINKHLLLIGLQAKVTLQDKRLWQYSFTFFDTKRNRAIIDINSLSAGQKSILHLIFECYGRDEMRGGLVIIDEPEVHLHYQFQQEYLKVLTTLSEETKCQYILVTHSDSLINSQTIEFVTRFAMNGLGETVTFSPNLQASQKSLIKILDNSRSTYALFAKKVVLVEGETDRYFFKACMHELYPHLDQEIAVLYVGGKLSFQNWTNVFSQFGLEVFRIADLDYAYNCFYPNESKTSLKTQVAVSAFKTQHPDIQSKITAEYLNKSFILRDGDLEFYLKITKDLEDVIDFTNDKLRMFLADSTNLQSLEVKNILKHICE